MESALKTLLENAVLNEKLTCGAVLGVTHKGGFEQLVAPIGTLSASGSDPVRADSIAWLASLTKLITAIALLQLVEQGSVSLDSSEQVASLLPELANLELLTDFDPETKAFKISRASRVPTVRELMIHTSGLEYDIISPALMAWRASRGESFKWLERDIKEAYTAPMTHEPGTSWRYSPGIDWTGKLIERVSGMSLSEYFAKYIYKPLGVVDMTFQIETEPELQARTMKHCTRLPDGVLKDGGPSPAWTKPGPGGDDRGGVGLYSSVPDYLKILTSLVKNDGQLLKPESIDLLFKPQCSGASKASIRGSLASPHGGSMFPGMPKEADLNFSIGGAVLESDVKGVGPAGTAFWSGLPNTLWILNRSAKYAAVFITSYTPTRDVKLGELMGKVYGALENYA